jgi:hypothetical protein
VVGDLLAEGTMPCIMRSAPSAYVWPTEPTAVSSYHESPPRSLPSQVTSMEMCIDKID